MTVFYIKNNLFNDERVKKLISDNFGISKRTKCYVYFLLNGNNIVIEKINKPTLENWYKKFGYWVARGSPELPAEIKVIDSPEKLSLIPDGDKSE
jgi:hypothetical protein